MSFDSDTAIYSIFDTMPPAVKERLEKTDAYRRFILERTKLGALAAKAWAETGKLNSAAILAWEQTVAALGAEVLGEIKAIELMLTEPSCEAFQKQRRE